MFRKIWPDEWGPRLEHLLRNVLLTLLEDGDSTLADIPPLLTDRTHRAAIIERLSDMVVKDFWKTEYQGYSPAFRAVITAPLQNKIGALLTDPVLRRILTEEGDQLDLDRVVNGGSILLVNLDKGSIGEGPASLLGSILVSQIALAGMARSTKPASERRNYFIYLDEFQNYTTLAIATALAELRKYGVGFVLAHQHLAQLEPEIRDAVFGNAGSIISFRMGGQDASYLAREFSPKFDATDITNLPRFSAYARLQIDGASSPPFSFDTLAELPIDSND